MTPTELDQSVEARIARISRLPDHGPAARALASRRLSMLEAAIPVPFLDVDVRNMSRSECISTIRRIAGMGPEELSRRRGIERTLDAMYGSHPSEAERQEWARAVKASRIDQLVRAFELVSRLRSDEPEAWDEIEELYFDD